MADGDGRLIARVLAHDAGALEEWIAGIRPFVFAILIRHLHFNREDAEDVCQQFLLRLWEDDFRRLRRWRGKTDLLAYLAAIVRNLAHDYRRARQWEMSGERPEQSPGVGNAGLPPDPVSTLAVRDALARLPERDRTVLYRRYFLGESYRDLGAALGMTPNHAGVALARAEKRLRRFLDSDGT